MFQIELELDKESEKWMTELPHEFRKAMIRGVKQGILFAEAQSKKSFGKSGNLKVRSGHLRRSIKSTIKERHKEIVGTLSNNVIYAGIHEYGGVIKPKKGKYLTFKVGDRWVKVTSVKIPARPFIRPAIEDNLTKIVNIIEDVITREMNK